MEHNDKNKIVDDCVSFPSYDVGGLRYVKKLAVETSHPSHFHMRYELEGSLECNNITLVYPRPDGGSCEKVSKACSWMETLPNEKSCYVECECMNGACNGMLLVENVPGQQEWTLCGVELG